MRFEPKEHRFPRRGRPHIALHILKFIAVILLISFITMELWNHLMPELFSFHALTFLQSMGLIVMVRLIIGTHAPRQPFSRLGARPSWREYEAWWNDSGRKSFKEYAAQYRRDHCCPVDEKDE